MTHSILLGTRPEIIKLSPLIREYQRKKYKFFIIHTNQHYSPQMDLIFFKELGLTTPKYNLKVGSDTQARQTAKILMRVEKVLVKEKPTIVYVQGDTNTTLAGALAARKLNIKLAHIEAGLRSYDEQMPEETNRKLTDHMSDYLFAPTSKAVNILKKENILSKIFNVGNTIVDAVHQNIRIAEKKVDVLKKFHLQKNKFFLLTLHRPSNVDDKNTLQEILKGLQLVYQKYRLPIFFPVHPRTEKQLKKFNIHLSSVFQVTQPVSFLEMLQLEQKSKIIFTDSGGMQEEACILQKKCLTLRKNTERPETLQIGGNILTTLLASDICKKTIKMVRKKVQWYNPYGDGKTGKKIIKIILKEKRP